MTIVTDKIIDFLKDNGTATPTEIAKKTGIHSYLVNQILGDLETEGIVKRIDKETSTGMVTYTYWSLK